MIRHYVFGDGRDRQHPQLMRIQQLYHLLQLQNGLLLKQRDMMRRVGIFRISLSRVKLNNIEKSDIFLPVRSRLHANNLSIDGSDQLRLKIGKTKSPLQSLPVGQPLVDGGFPDSFLDVDLSNQIFDGVKNLIPLSFGRKRHVHTIAFAVEIQPVFEETEIASYLHMTVFVEINSNQLLVSQFFVDQNSQIRK